MAVVLVVEDDPDNLELIAETVRQLTYDVRRAKTAAEALQTVRQAPPDAILLDIKLPDATGTSGLDLLRKALPGVPIIMLTGNTDAVTARETLTHGAFDYITKPFDVGRLKTVLETALASS